MKISNGLKTDFAKKMQGGGVLTIGLFSLIFVAGLLYVFLGAKAADDPKCVLSISKAVDKSGAAIGDALTYTLNFSNSGDADCTGGGVKVKDIVDGNLVFLSETHTDNVEAGYNAEPNYDNSSRILLWNAGDLTPGESGSVTWKAEIKDPESCGDFDIANTGSISSWEYLEFNDWVHSNTVHTVFSKSCPVPTPTPALFVFPSCESLLPTPGDKAHYETGWHQIAGGPLLEGSDDVYSLEENNYTQCFCPAEGDKGIQSNWLRTDQKIDGWFFENGMQWDLGDFNYAVQNLDFNCNPSPTPAPTPTPTPVPVPDIHLTKTASPSVLPYGGGQVDYTYQITNTGDLPLSDITLTDDKCNSVVFASGDANQDNLLDLAEIWTYKCSANLIEATTNTAIASGKANGQTVKDTATASVTISGPIVASGGGGGGYNPSPIPTPIPSNPALKITKTAYPASLPSGGGQVTYTYQVFNKGDMPFSSVIFADDKCSDVNLIGGDANQNSMLDIAEVWTYTCQDNLKATTTNSVTVRGQAGNFWVTDIASLAVRVGEPVIPKYMPKAGGGGFYNSLFGFLEEIISFASHKLQ